MNREQAERNIKLAEALESGKYKQGFNFPGDRYGLPLTSGSRIRRGGSNPMNLALLHEQAKSTVRLDAVEMCLMLQDRNDQLMIVNNILREDNYMLMNQRIRSGKLYGSFCVGCGLVAVVAILASFMGWLG